MKLLFECKIPDPLHIIPVRHNAPVYWIVKRHGLPSILGLVANIEVFPALTDLQFCMGCRFTIYSLFMDIHNSFIDIHNSFIDIHNSFMDILK